MCCVFCVVSWLLRVCCVLLVVGCCVLFVFDDYDNCRLMCLCVVICVCCSLVCVYCVIVSVCCLLLKLLYIGGC